MLLIILYYIGINYKSQSLESIPPKVNLNLMSQSISYLNQAKSVVSQFRISGINSCILQLELLSAYHAIGQFVKFPELIADLETYIEQYLPKTDF